VQALDFVGGAEDSREEFRDAGVHGLGIHRPPIPFPFFPPNFQNVWGSSVGLGVGLGLRDGCDFGYAPTSLSLDNFHGSGH
jgi:hypothetical protein